MTRSTAKSEHLVTVGHRPSNYSANQFEQSVNDYEFSLKKISVLNNTTDIYEGTSIPTIDVLGRGKPNSVDEKVTSTWFLPSKPLLS